MLTDPPYGLSGMGQGEGTWGEAVRIALTKKGMGDDEACGEICTIGGSAEQIDGLGWELMCNLTPSTAAGWYGEKPHWERHEVGDE